MTSTSDMVPSSPVAEEASTEPRAHAFTVAIVTSDRGWILEKLAAEITKRFDNWHLVDDAPADADVVYYMTYAARKREHPGIEVAYCTHIEHGTPAEEAFFRVAKEVDWSVCHSRPYEDALRSAGVETVTTIPPGIDFDEFFPKLRIGVVGRTYHTGRKGEHIVRQLLDLDFVEWHFTGDGWPLPSERVPPGRMGDFYRRMDYVLVPALYEGGPMCVPEALACGTRVIAPPVGWVPDFPHIEYPTGDVAALREVLRRLFDEKRELAESTAEYTWERWANAHQELFARLYEEHGGRGRREERPVVALRTGADSGEVAPSSSPPRTKTLPQVVHILHGNERNSKGGPSVRVPRTASLLREAGHESFVRFHPYEEVPEADVAHVYNVWQPSTALAAVKSAKKRCGAVVFSPVFLNLAFRRIWEDEVLRVLSRYEDVAGRRSAFRWLHNRFEKACTELGVEAVRVLEPQAGFNERLCELIELSDHIVCLSSAEYRCLRVIYGADFESTVVCNPVDGDYWRTASGEPFSREVGVDDYALCVGRLEPRKNQAALALALNGTEVPLVFVGQAGSREYADHVHSCAGDNAIFTGHMAHDDPLLASAYAGASVVVSVSCAEGAPLSLLEGATAGAEMVVSAVSSEKEYFGDYAKYVAPFDLPEIRQKVLRARDATRRRGTRAEYFTKSYSWANHLRRLQRVYEAVSESSVADDVLL